jgi:hypothetical protein
MKRNTTPQPDVWNENAEPAQEQTQEEIQAVFDPKPEVEEPVLESLIPEYDLDGLKTDFPTATDLERFVYDQTQVALQLKGLANNLKYDLALKVLNGKDIEPKYLSRENPHLDKNDLVPVEPLKPIPQRDKRLPGTDDIQYLFHEHRFPHTDTDLRALGAYVVVCFRKYKNGMISYEVEGPLEKRSYGEKLDKYGRARPEVIKYIDPRSGEQLLKDKDGSITPQGLKIKAYIETMLKVNKRSSVWDVWIDRNLSAFNRDSVDNPWA